VKALLATVLDVMEGMLPDMQDPLFLFDPIRGGT
jgi:hypothetical protein